MTVKGYIIPEFKETVLGKQSELSREHVPKKVVFSEKII